MTQSYSTTTIIKPQSEQKLSDGMRELWQFRELLWTFAIRNVGVRYKQTVLGIAWVVLQPLLTTAIFTLVFSHMARIPSQDAPYPVFVFSGLLLWQYFSRCVLDGAGSLQANSGMLSKVYFPRMLMPMVAPLSSAIDFAISFMVLLALMFYYKVVPGFSVFAVPLLLIAAGMLGFGISLVLAPLNALRRDIAIALPFVLQMAMYLTPIIYPITFVPERFQWLFLLNPMATLLDGMRWALLGATAPPVSAWAVFAGMLVLLLAAGRWLFRRTEATLVDAL
ncbi:MAG TPA: phosphate ABC transporter permease [Oxalobacteraceae bacterium]|nr:phosphate ABC transporter permease [Oxalobacteraceae bacterium]